MGTASSKRRPTRISIPNIPGQIFAGFVHQFKNQNYFREIMLEPGKSVLVCKADGKFFAVGSKCPHLGGPLGKGIFRLGRIRCPWHGACFDMTTGEMEDYPGYDNLPQYHCSVRNECVFISIDIQKMPDRYIKPMSKMTDKWSKVVIIGCGAAGYTCAQTLRQEGYTGRVIMITEEKYFPYDRSQITKFPGAEFKHLKIRSASFYLDNDIEVLTNTKVSKVEVHDHKIHFEGKTGTQLEFDMLFITTGSKPRFYSGNVHGCRMRNIVTIANMDQAASVAEMTEGNSVVILGSGFVAMELAESLSRTAEHIHIISRHKAPYGIVMGETTGKAILQHFLENVNNVTFYCTDDVYTFKGNKKDEVEQVITMKRRVINCKLVIVAIGVMPRTELFRPTPIKLHPVDKSILVNKFMETNIQFIYAGGDCCNFPLYIGARDRANITHWQVACTHGKVAALNMLGKNISIMDVIPYFWTNIFGLSIRYIGHGESYDEVLIYGSLEYKCFCTVFRRRKKFIACCAVGCEPLASEVCVAIEIKPDWCDEVPTPITERFPEEPCAVEVYHGFKMREDIHTHDHDLEQYEMAPRPINDKMMIKEHKKEVYFRTAVNDEMNMLRDPEKPTFDLQMLTLRREINEQYARENEKTTRYERLSKVYVNNPEDDTIDYFQSGVGSASQFPKSKLPPFRLSKAYDETTVPYSLRYAKQKPEIVKKKFKVPDKARVPTVIRASSTKEHRRDADRTEDRYLPSIAEKRDPPVPPVSPMEKEADTYLRYEPDHTDRQEPLAKRRSRKGRKKKGGSRMSMRSRRRPPILDLDLETMPRVPSREELRRIMEEQKPARRPKYQVGRAKSPAHLQVPPPYYHRPKR